MRAVHGVADGANPAGEAATEAPRLLPGELSADNGYFSEENIQTLETEKIDAYVATGRLKHGEDPPVAATGEAACEGASVKEQMAQKLRTDKGAGDLRQTQAARGAGLRPDQGGARDQAVFCCAGWSKSRPSGS